jgi:hypothetical protein
LGSEWIAFGELGQACEKLCFFHGVLG